MINYWFKSFGREGRAEHISSAPGEDRCPYGFTDAVGKRGDQLFDSLLFIQAARRLGEMLTALARPDEYQNGGYWATPTGWFVYTLALVDVAKARQTVVDLVADFARRGICEWGVWGETACLPGYVANAAIPLQGIRALQ